MTTADAAAQTCAGLAAAETAAAVAAPSPLARTPAALPAILPAVLRVALLGAESTGKSTLAEALAARHGSAWVPEYLREFVAHHGRVPLEHEQWPIARCQQQREEQAARALAARTDVPGGTASAWLFCDTTPLMTALYSAHYFQRVDAPLAALASTHSYALTIVTPPDTPWVADGLQRESDDVRQMMHRRLLAMLAQRGICYTLASGPLPQRLATVAQALALVLARECGSRQAHSDASSPGCHGAHG
ncbi:MAG: AAA family ATPase [Janthinobacterium lividum]